MITRRPTRRTDRRAFTLIETIVAIVILTIAVPPMLWAVRDAHVQRVDTIMASRARWLIEARLEDVVADRHAAGRGWTYLVNGNYPAEDPVASDPQYARTVEITETGADLVTPGTGYKSVVVAVEWSDGSGKVRELQIATVLTEYTP